MIWFAVEDVTYSKLNVKYHVTYMICCMAVVTRILVELVPFKPPYSLMLSKFIACCQCLAAPASKLTSTASWTAGLAKALGAGLTRTLYYVHDLVSAAALPCAVCI